MYGCVVRCGGGVECMYVRGCRCEGRCGCVGRCGGGVECMCLRGYGCEGSVGEVWV